VQGESNLSTSKLRGFLVNYLSSGHARWPCAARTRLLRLLNTQKGRCKPPIPRPLQLRSSPPNDIKRKSAKIPVLKENLVSISASLIVQQCNCRWRRESMFLRLGKKKNNSYKPSLSPIPTLILVVSLIISAWANKAAYTSIHQHCGLSFTNWEN
jgi:hypothetical protein